MVVFLVTVGVGVCVVLGLFAFYYNRLVRLNNRVLNAWSQIDVQLARQAALVPMLVQVLGVSGLGVRSEALEEAESAYRVVQDAVGVEENMNAQARLTASINHLNSLARFPKKGGNPQVHSVLCEVRDAEDKVSYMRQSFNDTVALYNEAVERFPTNIIAELFDFPIRPMLQIDPALKYV